MKKLSKWSAVDEFLKKSKPSLLRFIMSSLRKLPKKRLAYFAYAIHHEQLPRLRTTKQKALPKCKTKRKFSNVKIHPSMYALPKRKTKRKFSAKQLAAQRLFAKRARAGTLRKR